MGQREAQSLGHHLRCRCCTQKLTSTARRAAGTAAHGGRILEADEPVGEARPDGLNLAGIFSIAGWQGYAAGNNDRGKITAAGQGHHHGGQALVAGRHTHDAFAGGQAARQTAQHHGSVVAVRQAVHHACGALGAAVARIGHKPGKGNAT